MEINPNITPRAIATVESVLILSFSSLSSAFLFLVSSFEALCRSDSEKKSSSFSAFPASLATITLVSIPVISSPKSSLSITAYSIFSARAFNSKYSYSALYPSEAFPIPFELLTITFTIVLVGSFDNNILLDDSTIPTILSLSKGTSKKADILFKNVVYITSSAKNSSLVMANLKLI